MRERVPLSGFAGGFPGANTRFALRKDGGEWKYVSGHDNHVVVGRNDEFEFEIGSGGGFGDPVDRDPQLVAADVMADRYTASEAVQSYGVMLMDTGFADLLKTEQCRRDVLQDRLKRARPAKKAMHGMASPAGAGQPLYVGIEQRGDLAISSESGAVLARAPDHWTDGCPVLVGMIGDHAESHAYLDPLTGRSLLVDVLPVGMKRTMASLPRRWVDSAQRPDSAAAAA